MVPLAHCQSELHKLKNTQSWQFISSRDPNSTAAARNVVLYFCIVVCKSHVCTQIAANGRTHSAVEAYRMGAPHQARFMAVSERIMYDYVYNANSTTSSMAPSAQVNVPKK